MSFSRRDFLSASVLGSASVALNLHGQPTPDRQPQQDTGPAKRSDPEKPSKRPVIISKYTGSQAIHGAYQMLRRGGDTLDAALFMCRSQEDDPSDNTVGLGGLPNAEGVVELDACCMHGPSRRAGAVAAVQNIKNVSRLARLVMERTDHVLLVGEGAQRFALAHGFAKEDLLTEHGRKVWLLWKETMSRQDNWGPGLDSPEWTPPPEVPDEQDSSRRLVPRLYEMSADLGIAPALRMQAVRDVLHPPTGTIHVSVVNEDGEMSGATTTSGLAWKLPGRVGDSPIIGAGCWTDQDVGSAGATGRGEEVIKISGSHTIVENMRHGMSPEEAGLNALRRISRNFNDDKRRLRFMDVVFYVLRKDGAYAGVSLWSHGSSGKRRNFAVHDGEARLEETVALYQGSSVEWPPEPQLPRG